MEVLCTSEGTLSRDKIGRLSSGNWDKGIRNEATVLPAKDIDTRIGKEKKTVWI